MSREADIFLPQREGYVVLDIESQGYVRFCPIEISAVRFSPVGEKIDTFSSFVRPRVPRLNRHITELTGITIDMVRNAPLPSEVILQVREFLGRSVIVGHAVGENDIPILDHFYRELYREAFKNPYVDTFYWAQQLFPDLGTGHYNLKALAEQFEIGAESFHRAEVDCITTARVYQVLYERAAALSAGARRKILHDFAHKNDPKEPSPEKQHKQPPRFDYNLLPIRPRSIDRGVVVKLWFARGHACMELRFYPRVPPEFEDFMDKHSGCGWQEFPNGLCSASRIAVPLAAVVLRRLQSADCAIYRKDAGAFCGFDPVPAKKSKRAEKPLLTAELD